MRYFVLSIFCLTLMGCGLDETLHRADKPVSREVASRDISLPFPDSTRDVYYVFHAGGMQELQMLLALLMAARECMSGFVVLSRYMRERNDHAGANMR